MLCNHYGIQQLVRDVFERAVQFCCPMTVIHQEFPWVQHSLCEDAPVGDCHSVGVASVDSELLKVIQSNPWHYTAVHSICQDFIDSAYILQNHRPEYSLYHNELSQAMSSYTPVFFLSLLSYKSLWREEQPTTSCCKLATN